MVEVKQMELQIGKEYVINHSRKGTFIGKVLKDTGEWVTIRIVKGKADYMSISNNLMSRGNIGDEITIRKSFCTFKMLRMVEENKNEERSCRFCDLECCHFSIW